jgi:hypothetical protein
LKENEENPKHFAEGKTYDYLLSTEIWYIHLQMMAINLLKLPRYGASKCCNTEISTRKVI